VGPREDFPGTPMNGAPAKECNGRIRTNSSRTWLKRTVEQVLRSRLTGDAVRTDGNSRRIAPLRGGVAVEREGPTARCGCSKRSTISLSSRTWVTEASPLASRGFLGLARDAGWFVGPRISGLGPDYGGSARSTKRCAMPA